VRGRHLFLGVRPGLPDGPQLGEAGGTFVFEALESLVRRQPLTMGFGPGRIE
jgi:hypothetical protein